MFLMVSVTALGQDQDVIKAAMCLSGADSEEELDASIVEMLESRRGRLVYVNSNSLRASGILNDYQVAVIKDYRSRCGDILSWEELSMLEGFNRADVEALRPFLSLYSSKLPGAADTVSVKTQALLRATLTSAGGKAKVMGRHWQAGGAVRCGEKYKKWDGTFFGEASLGNYTVWAGDFKLRFAEGLALWTGFAMDNLSTVDAFAKRAQGISPVWSYSSSGIQRGLAAEYSGNRWKASAFASIDKTIGARAEYLGRRFQAGLTAATLPCAPYMISADAKLNLKGTLISGEVAFRNGSFSGKTAIVAPLGEHFRMALQGRIVPSKYSGKKYGEYAFAGGLDYRGKKLQASLTADASLLPIPVKDPGRVQVRSYARVLWKASDSWSFEGRLTERYRNYERPRTALRLHCGFSYRQWNANARGETVWCEKAGMLGYLEGGYKTDNLAAWLRFTGFNAQKWNDRIYVYERDAPGTFNVPAYYGQGCAIALAGSWKHRFRYLTVKVYVRGAYTFKNGSVPAPVLNVSLLSDVAPQKSYRP